MVGAWSTALVTFWVMILKKVAGWTTSTSESSFSSGGRSSEVILMMSEDEHVEPPVLSPSSEPEGEALPVVPTGPPLCCAPLPSSCDPDGEAAE